VTIVDFQQIKIILMRNIPRLVLHDAIRVNRTFLKVKDCRRISSYAPSNSSNSCIIDIRRRNCLLLDISYQSYWYWLNAKSTSKVSELYNIRIDHKKTIPKRLSSPHNLFDPLKCLKCSPNCIDTADLRNWILNEPFVYLILKRSGLGNQLFQFACAGVRME